MAFLHVVTENHYLKITKVNGSMPKTICARGKSWIRPYRYHIPGDPKKYFCLIKRKMHNKRGIFKTEKRLDYQ